MSLRVNTNYLDILVFIDTTLFHYVVLLVNQGSSEADDAMNCYVNIMWITFLVSGCSISVEMQILRKLLKFNTMAYDAGMLAASASVLNNAANVGFAARSNMASRKFAREMYWMQRGDALADWTMQNEYNSPQAQMQRLKAAGLNPNLVYGHGAVADAGAVRPSSPTSMNFKTPDFDMGSTVGSYLDAKMKNQQLDNLKAQNTVITNEAILRAAQIDATVASTDSTRAGIGRTNVLTKQGEFKLGLDTELRNISLEMASAGLEKIRSSTSVMLDANERAMLTNNMSLKEAAERILNHRQSRSESGQRIVNMRIANELSGKDIELKSLDINLKRLGLQPTDQLWQRALGRILSGNSVNDVLNEFKPIWKGKNYYNPDSTDFPQWLKDKYKFK